MDSIQIASRLYDYEVRFTEDLAWELAAFPPETTAYVIDRKVASLYAEKRGRAEGYGYGHGDRVFLAVNWSA